MTKEFQLSRHLEALEMKSFCCKLLWADVESSLSIHRLAEFASLLTENFSRNEFPLVFLAPEERFVTLFALLLSQSLAGKPCRLV